MVSPPQSYHPVPLPAHHYLPPEKAQAEAEVLAFYNGGGGDKWLKALEPRETGPDKPHITKAKRLIIVFA